MMKKIVLFHKRGPEDQFVAKNNNYDWLKQWVWLYGIDLYMHHWSEPSYDQLTYVMNDQPESVVILEQPDLAAVMETAMGRKWWSGWKKHRFHSYSDDADTQFFYLGIGTNADQRRQQDHLHEHLRAFKLTVPLWVPWHRRGWPHHSTQPLINTGLGMDAEIYDVPPHITEHPGNRGPAHNDFLFLVRRKPDASGIGRIGHRNHLIDRVLDRLGDRCLNTQTATGNTFHNDIEATWSRRVAQSLRIPPDRNYPRGDRYIGTYTVRPDLYARTRAELVCETISDLGTDQRLYMITEKMWKPLMMGHPWLVFHQPGFLRYMRRLGFRTFHDHCDEGYDAVIDPHQRVERICDAMEQISHRGAQQFYDDTRSIREHNQRRYLVLRARNEQHLFRQFERWLRPQLD